MAKNPSEFVVDAATNYHDKIGDLDNLITNNKDTLVDAINEVAASGGPGGGPPITNNEIDKIFP